MASTYLTRTPSSTGNQTKFTFSFWWKNNCLHGNDKCFFSSGLNSSNYFMIRTTGNEQVELLALDNTVATMRYKPSRLYRDANAWYHIVIAIDTTQAGGNRLKWYTNGVRETAFDLSIEPNQNANLLYVNDTTTHAIGRKNVTSDKYMDGTLSHYHFIDGTAYDASAFGEYDANGVWKIKTSPSVTYGNNGFFIFKDGNSLTDQSGNSNNFTVGGGTLTKTEDCPSNVFCTLSPLHKLGTNTGTYSNGNTKYADANSNWQGTMCTLGATSGKYYWEYQLVAGTYHMIGVMPDNVNLISSSVFDTIGGYSAYIDNGYIEARYNNADISGWSKSDLGNTTFSTNDYINLAVDMDNKFMYIGKNGTWLKSGDPTSGAIGTGGINVSATFTSGVFMIPVISAYNGTTGQFNFGNGYMGNTAVSTPGTNASGNGIFEFDVPTGYTALSTKGLNL